MILAEPDHSFSWNYFISASSHEAYWDKKWTSEQCSLLIDGVLHEVKKHGRSSGYWTLERDGKVLVSGKKLRGFKRSFSIETSSGELSLMAESALRRRFIVGREAELVAMISPRNIFSRKVQFELLDEDLEFPVAVFLIWLVVLSWRRQQGSG